MVVTINITDDLIGTPPCSLQLNRWSPKPNKQEQRQDGGSFDAWQQYGLSWEPGFGNLVGSYAENWPNSGPNLFNIVPAGFWSIEDSGTKIPAGTAITIILSQLNRNTGSISGSVVVVANGSSAALQMNIIAWGTPAGQPSPKTIFTKGGGDDYVLLQHSHDRDLWPPDGC